jgi:hypothetical protein
MTPSATLPRDGTVGALAGRVWRPEVGGPSVVAVRGDGVWDISKLAPTVRDLAESTDAVAMLREGKGERIGALQDILANTPEAQRDATKPWLLAPIDLQAIKAAGVTFPLSMLERVIEEQARGSPAKAEAIRKSIAAQLGGDLAKLVPGSMQAAELKRVLIEQGAWSQYLEVGIGPDAEIFTKAQPMAAVGHGMDAGLHPISSWNNPEPEVVLVVSAKGTIVGATLGNDVNLRDFEGRSALLLAMFVGLIPDRLNALSLGRAALAPSAADLVGQFAFRLVFVEHLDLHRAGIDRGARVDVDRGCSAIGRGALGVRISPHDSGPKGGSPRELWMCMNRLAEARARARLAPQLENIASELNLEIKRALAESNPTLRIHASFGYAVAEIPEVIRQDGRVALELQYFAATDALASLARGGCDMAGFHVPEGALGARALVQFGRGDWPGISRTASRIADLFGEERAHFLAQLLAFGRQADRIETEGCGHQDVSGCLD